MKETFMKKRYLFVAVAILAAGLVFFGCDLLEPEEDDPDVPPPGKVNWSINGTAETKRVTIKFTSDESMKPQNGDSYKISYDNAEVSSGKINVNGNTATPTITFIPSSGGTQFEAILDIGKLTFPRGIATSTGTIMGYVSDGSSTPPNPVFDAGGNLSSTPIILTLGDEPATLRVAANANGGGSLYYQWYKNTENNNTSGTAIIGATNVSYTVLTTTVSSFYYYVKVGNASGGVITSQPQEVRVVDTRIIVGDGSGMTPFYNLKEAITTLLGTALNMDYTVYFTVDLAYPLFINGEDFPGTGKLTIKSSKQFSKGIYITRSNVELYELDISIRDIDHAAKYTINEPCAVLISDRYYLASQHTPTTPSVDTYPGYITYESSAIKGVSIEKCKIDFSGIFNVVITGICVDPYTAGRTTGPLDTRVRIKDTTVIVNNVPPPEGAGAQCFMGNNTDFIENKFTSSGIVAFIRFLFSLTYGDRSDTNTVSFSNNKFTSSAVDNLVFKVHVNAAARYDQNYPDYRSYCNAPVVEGIIETCQTYGKEGHKFGELASNYRRLIEILFAQIYPGPDGKKILVDDCWDDMYQTFPDDTRPTDVYYKMEPGNSITAQPGHTEVVTP
jgi:hypothetical protein